MEETHPVSCPHCGCQELFVRKKFPQKLGLMLVIGASIAALILFARGTTFYLGVFVLLGVTALDALLYFFVGKVVVCYRCRRDLPQVKEAGAFDRAVAEKYRQT